MITDELISFRILYTYNFDQRTNIEH